MAFVNAIRERLAGLKNRISPAVPSPLATSAATPTPAFSFSHGFRQGMFAGASIFLILVFWMWLRTGDTAEKIQPLLPFQSVALSSPQEKEAGEKAEESADNAPEIAKLVAGRPVEPLPPAPIEGLYETVEGKSLPRIRFEDDLTPFAAYRRPHEPVAGRPQVALVIVDYGLNGRFSQSMLDTLPAEITFALSPYAADAVKWANAARAYGHEFWLSLPMKGANPAVDAGPDAIDPKASLEQNTSRTTGLLSTAPGYAGIVTMKNHGLTAADLSARAALKQIYGRGLAIAESNPDIAAWGLTEALEAGHPYVQNNFWLDSTLAPDAIDAALREVERQASRKGKAVAFLHPTPLGIQKAADWAKEAEEKGIQLAPLSAMVAQ